MSTQLGFNLGGADYKADDKKDDSDHGKNFNLINIGNSAGAKKEVIFTVVAVVLLTTMIFAVLVPFSSRADP